MEIRDLRTLVEGEGAARAASLASNDEIDRLERIHLRYIATEGEKDFAAALAKNENFHFTLCRMGQSPVLFTIVENLWMQFGPLLSYLYDDGTRPFHGRTHGHVLVIDSLRKRDPEMARNAIKQDILIGGQAVLDKLPRVRHMVDHGADHLHFGCNEPGAGKPRSVVMAGRLLRRRRCRSRSMRKASCASSTAART